MKNTGFSIILLISYSISLFAQQSSDTLAYTRQEVLIPMRDGIKLFTVIYSPNNAKEQLPFLLTRTPYGVSDISSPDKIDLTKCLAKEEYIFVFQDIRGRYKSEGTFEMLRFTRDRKDINTVDESTDTYDTIDWLLRNIFDNNGKVGIFGTSYNGWTTMMGTIDPHPALKAACEMATPADMFIGDDFHHNGAFRLSYGFEYVYMEEFSKKDSLFNFDKYDTYEWYLNLGKLSNVNTTYFHNNLPSRNDFVMHPNYDDFWKKQSLIYRLDAPELPTLHVAGWWDQEDYYGPLKAYEILEIKDQMNQNNIVIGPWNHGGWESGTGNMLGNINFGAPTAEKFRNEILAPFFSYYLKGKGDGKFPEAVTFQTGSNIWRKYNKWPPINVTTIENLYLSNTGKLSFDIPHENEAYDEYISDPDHPVPYRPRPVEATYGPCSRWFTWLLEDQRFVHNRPDVASWETKTLTEDITVTGNLFTDIFASTSGSDADWIIKLIDVYPENYPESQKMGGYQLMIASDVFRGRFRNSYSIPEPVKPDEVNEYKIDLHAVNHVFKKGHKIMVQIQSTWFPIIDRNPQKYIPNIFEAEESDFIVTKQKIYRSAKFPSHIELPVLKELVILTTAIHVQGSNNIFTFL
jgi:putative CocE/NonD family hydrolase